MGLDYISWFPKEGGLSHTTNAHTNFSSKLYIICKYFLYRNESSCIKQDKLIL